MASFSERVGAVAPRIGFQLESMDAPLRNSIWNFVLTSFDGHSGEYWRPACSHFSRVFFKTPADEVPGWPVQCRDWLKEKYYALKWYEAYEFVICLCNGLQYLDSSHPKRRPSDHHQFFNFLFERELGGYRFIAGQLSPISDRLEVEAIEQASSTKLPGLESAKEHLATAQRHLSLRPDPDFRNSIKESISAVESMAKMLTGVSNGGLAQALDALAKKHPMHGAMKEAFSRLYGYTSDKDGIRHALLDDTVPVGFDEAKFMLVTCSAFINFVAGKAAKDPV